MKKYIIRDREAIQVLAPNLYEATLEKLNKI